MAGKEGGAQRSAPGRNIDVSFDARTAEWWEAVARAGLRLRRALDEVLAKEESDTGSVDQYADDHPA